MKAYFANIARRRGVVLLLVIGAVSILTILALELSHRASIEVSQTKRSLRASATRRAIDSGVEIARALIAQGRKGEGYDALGDPWNKTIEASPESGVFLRVQMFDESGKLNIAQAMESGQDQGRIRKSLARLFAYLASVEPERAKMWKDTEAAVRIRLGIGSKEKPRPLASLDGLREAGIGAGAIFGEPAKDGRAGLALCDFLTAFGDGRINLNTSPAPVLYALDDEYDEALVGQIEAWRGTNSSDPDKKTTPFKTTKDLQLVPGVVEKQVINGRVQVVKDLFQKVQDRISVQSACFSAKVATRIDGNETIAWCFFGVPSSIPGQPLQSANVELLAIEEIEP